jgi:hypothetical protein
VSSCVRRSEERAQLLAVRPVTIAAIAFVAKCTFLPLKVQREVIGKIVPAIGTYTLSIGEQVYRRKGQPAVDIRLKF